MRKVFPHAQYEGCGVDLLGFYGLIRDEAPFDEGYLSLIEKEMQGLIEAPRSQVEMVASNGRERLLAKGEISLAHTLDGVAGLIELIQVGDYLDVGLGSAVRPSHFILLGFEREKDVVKIFGKSFSGFQEQKKFVKSWRSYPKRRHESLAKDLELYEGKNWHPRGVRLRQIFIDLRRKYLEKRGIEEVEVEHWLTYFLESGRKSFSVWESRQSDRVYFSGERGFHLALEALVGWIELLALSSKLRCLFIPSRKKKETIFVEKTLRELEVSYTVVGGRGDLPTIQFCIADAIGRFFPGPALQIRPEGVECTLFGDVQQFIGLLLEQWGGEIPISFAPEVIRLLPIDGVDPKSIIEILNRVNVGYRVDVEEGELKEKVHRALRVKVPYVIVFGKWEERARRVSLRAHHSKRERLVTFDELELFLMGRQFESE